MSKGGVEFVLKGDDLVGELEAESDRRGVLYTDSSSLAVRGGEEAAAEMVWDLLLCCGWDGAAGDVVLPSKPTVEVGEREGEDTSEASLSIGEDANPRRP